MANDKSCCYMSLKVRFNFVDYNELQAFMDATKRFVNGLNPNGESASTPNYCDVDELVFYVADVPPIPPSKSV